MTTSKPRSPRPGRACSVVTLLALILVALTATSAAAAGTNEAAVEAPIASAAGATATIASATDPTAAAAGAVAAPDASAPVPPITAASTQGATPAQTTGNDIRPDPAVIAAGAAAAPISRPAHVASSTHTQLESPIISSSPPAAPARATVTQLASDGPIVAAAAGERSRTAVARRATRHAAPFDARRLFAARAPRAAAPVVAVSVPIVNVYVGGQAGGPHHVDAKSTSAAGRGPAGLPAVSVSPFGVVPGQSGIPVMFGDAPFPSTGGIGPLLGLDSMLAALMLLAGITWRGRSWDLPVPRGESALFSLVLDRPG